MKDNAAGPFLLENEVEKQTREHAEELKRDRRYQRLQVMFNGILTLATIGTAIIVMNQGATLNESLSEMRATNDNMKTALAQAEAGLQLTRESLDATRESNIIAARSAQSAEIQASASKDQAEAAKVALKQADEDGRLNRRPWVTVRNAQIVNGWPLAEGSRAELGVAIHNTGVTPALNTMVSGAIMVGPGELPPGEAFPRKFVEDSMAANGNRHSQGLLPPGGMPFIQRVKSSRSFVKGDHEAVADGRYVLAYFGFIEYSDTLGEKHLTTFCFRTNQGQSGPELNFCDKWNSAR